ncbi:MAG TPA: hemerythrin domain-containing protein [Nocardioides sp.]|nr:hemerythrin domain-containing protein [Nocardioides sp.]
MGSATDDRAEAANLPEGDVVRVLLEQHARIRELFDEVNRAVGEEKQELFDELRALLAVHETAEEMVLRPVTSRTAGKDVARARNDEEASANSFLKLLEDMTIESADFSTQFVAFQHEVERHAEAEETEEFPVILSQCDENQRRVMGLQVRAAEKVAPTHAHPGAAGSTLAQWTVGPFASMVDRAKDALKAAM